ncbi:hypothetical protein GLOIN_2v1502041 [Rhizophagus clarus]|uniref:Uncharacterized protein n=1 Tax=Rhizophagus clarus TaxID=94130 RepID=A0A8H3LQK6_9GLOM|nr:hypothetical protein GLOIN_2v1502041 [Rhizophagus clarus]
MDAYILSIFQATYKLDDEDEGLDNRKRTHFSPQFEVVGDESTGQVVLCNQGPRGTYLSVFASNGISSISKDPLNIRYSESILKKGRKSFEVIFGLLKDRLECMDEEPDRKRARVGGYRSKNNRVMSSEIELLKQRIANLEAENVELKNENAKLRHIIVENAWRDPPSIIEKS